MNKRKGCLVMHVRSAMYTLLSQLSILSYVSLPFPLSLFFHFHLTILIPLGTVFFTPLLMFLSFVSWLLCYPFHCVVLPFLLSSLFSWSLCCLSRHVPIFMGTVPFILNINPRLFPFSTLAFHKHFVHCKHSANTHNMSC